MFHYYLTYRNPVPNRPPVAATKAAPCNIAQHSADGRRWMLKEAAQCRTVLRSAAAG